MSQTRSDLDRKISQLETRARDMTPRRYVQRHVPDYFAERVIGTTLLAVGGWMAWKRYRAV